jgi:hypothetical protein
MGTSARACQCGDAKGKHRGPSLWTHILKRSLGPDRFRQIRLTEMRPIEMRPVQIRAFEMGVLQIRPFQMRIH